jgi:hypothetical protein
MTTAWHADCVYYVLMRNGVRAAGWSGFLALVLVLVILPLGFCLAHGDTHDVQHAVCPGLCADPLGISAVAALLGLAEIARVPSDARRSVYLVPLIPSDPPPKLVLIS